MTKVYTGDNASQLYMDSLLDLLEEGKDVSPRGKKTLELRPVIFGYTNPLIRATFLKGRVINPFFQLAEALWILDGRSDVEWLAEYNGAMRQFSDDGTYFNAPYGERLRYWGRNDASNYINNPIDQLHDAFSKLVADPNTRQAYTTIYNPRFDNANKVTKDRPCNLGIDFKVRDNKLDATVFNRSNDLHWGTFGANLCQFATIQEAMASWLGLEVGTYYQITNSLHLYLDDYGAKETQKITDAYGIGDAPFSYVPTVQQFCTDTEPRISSDLPTWHSEVRYYFDYLDSVVRDSRTYNDSLILFRLHYNAVDSIKDPYLLMTIHTMMAYQAHKHEDIQGMLNCLQWIPDCSWKISMLRFLSKRYGQGSTAFPSYVGAFRLLYSHMSQDIIDYIDRVGE